MKKEFIVILIIAAFPLYTFAQKAKARASINKDTILIGDHVKMNLEVLTNGKTKVSWPEIKKNMTEGVEIIDQSNIDTVANEDGSLSYIRNFTITSFDSGFYEIKGLPIACMDELDTVFYKTLSNPLFLRVNTIKVDTTQAFKPIKGPISQGYTLNDYLPYIGGFILLLGIAIAIYFFVFKKKEEIKTFTKSKPKIPPHILALKQLETLKEKKLWQENYFKEYYTELTDIFRNYLDGRFNVDALEMTSDEIREELKRLNDIEEVMKSKVSKTLNIADLVKFAKMNPIPDDNQNSFSIITEFVKSTSMNKIEDKIEKNELAEFENGLGKE